MYHKYRVSGHDQPVGCPATVKFERNAIKFVPNPACKLGDSLSRARNCIPVLCTTEASPRRCAAAATVFVGPTTIPGQHMHACHLVHRRTTCIGAECARVCTLVCLYTQSSSQCRTHAVSCGAVRGRGTRVTGRSHIVAHASMCQRHRARVNGLRNTGNQ